MHYAFDFGVVLNAWPELAWGCWLTLRMSLLAMVLALSVALLIVWAKDSPIAPLRWVATAFVEVIRNTPFLVQVFFVFFGLPTLGIRMTAGVAAVLALGLNGAAFSAEIIRGGIASIKRGQSEAGFALGLSRLQTFRHVILRPALRAIFPALSGQLVLLLLTSSIVSSISAEELTSTAQILESTTFRSFEIYFTVTLIYLCIAVILSNMLKLINAVYFSYPLK